MAQNSETEFCVEKRTRIIERAQIMDRARMEDRVRKGLKKIVGRFTVCRNTVSCCMHAPCKSCK